MENKDKVRAYIKELVKKVIEEMTTTSATPGFLTPKAFRGNGDAAVSHTKKLSNKTGYTLTKRGESDANRPADKLTENRYYAYKNDESASPHQKIARAISELNRNLAEAERTLHINSRLQNECGIASEHLWERTKKSMIKIESRLARLSGKLREMRGN